MVYEVTKFTLKLARSNAAEMQLHVSIDCNSTKFELKLAGSNAAEIDLNFGPGLQLEQIRAEIRRLKMQLKLSYFF